MIVKKIDELPKILTKVGLQMQFIDEML